MMTFNDASVLSHSHESPYFSNITIHAYEIVIINHVMFLNPASSRQQSEGMLGRLSVVQSLHLHTITPDIKNEKIKMERKRQNSTSRFLFVLVKRGNLRNCKIFAVI